MSEASGNLHDTSGPIVRPPIAMALAVVAGLVLQWLYPLPFLPAAMPAGWVGGLVFLAGLALLIFAASTFRRAGTAVPTSVPTTSIVSDGPYRYSRNPIYVAMFIGLVGVSIGFDSLWHLILLVPFYLVIRHGVVAREEIYLARKFGDAYLGYKQSVRRWL
ncbi:methyltransferase family protein [Mesorhizobium sp. L-8-3]|uniref:methyltransferase family protein n=1 Tax=Mesorhizobium sp. L-8-3 TaxID=2744522 RepID=UPI00192555EE|nr:isoprenylcysteine carboxylmethyltransferase family protein [Mesorhizobium sp. L-8-3]